MRRLGRLLAVAGYAVCTGGYLGAMAAASQGAREGGGPAIGVTVALWADARTPNRWLTVSGFRSEPSALGKTRSPLR